MTIPAAATPLPSRILTLAAENATGVRRLIVRFVSWRIGFFPGSGASSWSTSASAFPPYSCSGHCTCGGRLPSPGCSGKCWRRS